MHANQLQLSLFILEECGRQLKGWKNKLINLRIYRDCDNPAAFSETFNNQISQAGDL